MATTGILTGGAVFLQADLDDDGTYVTVACTTEVSLEIVNELIEKICQTTGSPGVDYTGGLVRWTVNVSGLLSLDAVLGGMTLRALVKAGTKFKIRVQFGGTSGDDYEQGDVIVSNLSFTGVNRGGLNTWSATLQGCDVPTSAVVTP